MAVVRHWHHPVESGPRLGQRNCAMEHCLRLRRADRRASMPRSRKGSRKPRPTSMLRRHDVGHNRTIVRDRPTSRRAGYTRRTTRRPGTVVSSPTERRMSQGWPSSISQDRRKCETSHFDPVGATRSNGRRRKRPHTRGRKGGGPGDSNGVYSLPSAIRIGKPRF